MVKYKIKYFLLTIVLCFLSTDFLVAQSEADSLKTLLAKSKPDTFRLQILNALIEISPDGVWEKYNEQMGKEAEILLANKNPKIHASALTHKATYINNCGFIAFHFGDVPKAIESYHESLKIQEKLNNQSAVALAYNNIGYTYNSQGETDRALTFYQKAYDVYDKINSDGGRGLALNNIGYVYDQKARALMEHNGNPDTILNLLNKALPYYKRSLFLQEKTKDKYGIANLHNNIGALYANMIDQWRKLNINLDSVDYYSSLELSYHEKSLAMMTEIGDMRGVALATNNIGWHYFKKKQYKIAEEQSLRSLKLAKEMGFPGSIKDASRLLFNIYKADKQYMKALEMHELFISMRDSIQNDKNKKLGLQKQFQYEYEKKAAADSVRVSAEKEIIAAELKHEKTQKIALYAGLTLVIIFSLFIFNRFKTTQRQKKIIEKQKAEVVHQKELVDEKQKEILDSINYAKRLQLAILPPQHLIDKFLPENFVLYKPKDIVAGDFYWMHEENDIVWIAAADSTGHGVPGAMVSIVCSNSLDKAVKEFKLKEPGEILDKTTELVLDTFAKGGEEIKDGMDISLLCVDRKNKIIKWSGANNQLWYTHSGASSLPSLQTGASAPEVKATDEKKSLSPEALEGREATMYEVKANKQPVGKSDHQVPFTTHQFDWKAGAIFYLITDGYADQFGGPKGKKYKYKQLEERLLALANLPMQEQKNQLLNEFENWRGEHEQVDDVTLLAIKIV